MEDYRIIKLPSAKIREIARVAMEGYWKQLFLFMFFYYLIHNGVAGILDMFFVTTQQVPVGETGETITQTVFYGSGIYSAVISGPLAWALSKFMLDFFRFQKVSHSTLLEGFSHFVKAACLMLLMSAKIFLWSLLLLVPGVIAGFRYSQAFYILVDHPEYTVNQCLQESSRIMNGNKMKYFSLNLSFIGWNILAAVPTVCFVNITNSLSGIPALLFSMVLSIPLMFLNAYLNVAVTIFYELVINNLIIEDESEAASVNNGTWDVSMYSAPAPEETLVSPVAELPPAEEPEEAPEVKPQEE